MAKRIFSPKHDDLTRQKIQTSQIINRLMGHVMGKNKMTPSQVNAALGLIKKTLPDLQATELSGTIHGTFAEILSEVARRRAGANDGIVDAMGTEPEPVRH